MAKLTDWVRKATQKKGAAVDDSELKLAEEVESTGEAKKVASPADGAAFESYFLSAYRSLRTLEISGALTEANISLEDWVVLRALEKSYGPVTVKELIKATQLSSKKLRVIISALSERSLVNITEEEPKKVLISVSRTGLSVLEKMSTAFNAIASESSRYNGAVFARYSRFGAYIRRAIQKTSQKRRPSPSESVQTSPQ